MNIEWYRSIYVSSKPNMKRIRLNPPFAWAGLLLALCLVLSGCAERGQPTPEPTSPPTPTIAGAATPAAVPPAPAGRSAPAPSGELSTPELIDAALQRGEITPSQRWLYLAYAVYEYESLPEAYHSNVRWDGTLYLRDLNRQVADPQAFCALEPEVQAELRRLLPASAPCAP
jgi:hypothetical protein